METFSALLAFCAVNSPVIGELPAQRPVTRSFDVFFDLRLNQQLSKQWRRRWFETPLRSLRRHCNVLCFIAVRSWPVDLRDYLIWQMHLIQHDKTARHHKTKQAHENISYNIGTEHNLAPGTKEIANLHFTTIIPERTSKIHCTPSLKHNYFWF